MQAPKYAQPGQPARELNLFLELKVIADVGLVGFPNVGKSTLLSRVTNARPKIANYHFTTLNPNLGVVDLHDGADGFVIADIPGLIEGASEGIGLGHEFLRHIERTKVIIHMVDAASTEGRDPIADIYAISVKNVDTLLQAVSGLLKVFEHMPFVFEQEYFPEEEQAYDDDPFTVTYDAAEDEYVVEGPKIEKMLGYTNLESEKGFQFFQNFMKTNGILKQLEELGIQDGESVRMYGLSFDYYIY